MYSGLVLIGRGLNYRNLIIIIKNLLILGHYSKGGTPVLIPNTEVKSFSANGTAGFLGGRVGRGQE